MATQISGVSPTITVATAPPQTDPKAEAARILNETRIGSGATATYRIDFIEAKLDKIADADPKFAAAVRAEVMKGLSTTDQAALTRGEPGITRDAGNGQTVGFSTTSTKTQDQWIAEARAGNYRDLAIYTRLAGANDNASIKRAMDDVFAGRITPSEFAAAGAAVDEKTWTDSVGDFLANFSPAGLALEAAQPAIARLTRDAGLGNTEWGAHLQKVLDTPGSIRAFNAGVATGMVEGAKDFVVSIASLAGKAVQFGADNSLVGLAGDAARRVVPDSVKGWLRDIGIGGALNEALPSAQRGQASVEALGKMGSSVANYFASKTPAEVATDIKNGISKIWDSVKADHAKAAAQGPEAEARWWGKLVGKVTFEVAATFVPVAGVAGKVSKGAKGVDAATDLIRAGDKAADVVRTGDKVDDAARLGSKVDSVAESILSRARRILGDLPINNDTLNDLYRAGKLTMDEARSLAKSVNWKQADGGWIYPPNNGFHTPGTRQPIPVGQKLDRYGGFIDRDTGKFRDTGNFLSPAGESYGARALPPGTDANKPLKMYKVEVSFDALVGKATPWFDEPGMATQIMTDKTMSIEFLLKRGYISEIK
jgi:Tuberculosis necrotizing toxin